MRTSTHLPFDLLFDKAPFGLMVVTQQGLVADCNEAFLRMAGSQLDKVIGFDLFKAEDQTLVSYLKRAIAGETVDFEAVYRSTTGGRCSDFRYILHPLEDETLSILCFVEEIRERKDAERALQRAHDQLERRVQDRTAELRAAEARYRGLVEQSLAGHYLIDGSGRFLYVNPQLLQMLGCRDLGQVVGRRALGFVVPEDRARVLAAVRDGRSEDAADMRCSARLRGAAGGVIEVDGQGRPIEFDGTRAVIGIVIDVTEQRRIQRSLVDSQSRLQLFIDQSPFAQAMFDRESVCLASSRNWREDLASRFPGLNPGHCGPGTPASWQAACSRALAGDSPRHSQQAWLDRTGARRWLRWSIAPWMDAHSRIGGILVSAEDITASVDAENHRQQREVAHRETLVREVHHRIKNHLQGIVGLLGLHASRQDVVGVLDEAARQIQAIAWVYGLQATSGQQLDVGSLAHQIGRTHGALHPVQLSGCGVVPAARLAPDKAVAVALCLNELVQNAIKHGTADPVELAVETAGADAVQVTVVNRLDSTSRPAPDVERGYGLGTGLEILRALRPSQGARIEHRVAAGRMLAALVLTPPVLDVQPAGVLTREITQ